MSEKFIDITKPLEANRHSFPNNSPSLEIASNSPFQSGSIFNERKKVFPLEKKYGGTVHTVKK